MKFIVELHSFSEEDKSTAIRNLRDILTSDSPYLLDMVHVEELGDNNSIWPMKAVAENPRYIMILTPKMDEEFVFRSFKPMVERAIQGAEVKVMLYET